jgi:hypothetical protein
VVGTPAAHSRASTPVRAGVPIKTTSISSLARGLRAETVPRARELRRRGSATVTVGTRRRGKTSATPVVLHGDRVVLRAVVARRAVGAVGVGVLLVRAAAGADGADEGGEEEDGADDHDGDDDALVHACFGGGVAGVKGGEVGWGGGAGVEGCATAVGYSAAVGCAHGTGALLDSAHDSGGGGHVEAGYRGVGGVGGSSGAGNSRVVAAGVHHVKMHVRDGKCFCCFVWLLNGSLFLFGVRRMYCQSTFLSERVDDESKLVSRQRRDAILVLGTGVVCEGEQRVSASKTTHW